MKRDLLSHISRKLRLLLSQKKPSKSEEVVVVMDIHQQPDHHVSGSELEAVGVDVERRHSTTPSDVLDMDSTADRSQMDKEYLKDLSDAQLRRLEYLEDKFSQFSKFTQEQRHERQPKGRQPAQQGPDGNNNAPETGNKRRQVFREKQDLSSVKKSEVVHFTESPPFIKGGKMRDYQVDGLNWMISLYENGINGILADEMGLGKTLQSISILGYLKYHRKINGPHLVIVPLSTIGNWESEFKRFLPGMRVLHGHCYQYDKREFREALCAPNRSWDVVVTSYQFFVTEKTYFHKQHYQYVILDEAQRCKNENTLLPRFLRDMTYRAMLFLTGTPINNNLHELWALLNLLLPEFFRRADDFDNWFKVEDCIDPNHERAVRLKNILRPIMLRRIKADVELGIPPKLKTTIFMPPTRQMKYWSKKVISKDIQMLNGQGYYTNFNIAMVYPYLREVTLHPYLMPGAEPEPFQMGQHLVDASSRLIVLEKLLVKLKARGSRVLIFSQFVMLLNILDDYFVWKGYKFCRLTGSDPQEERQRLLDDFNAPDSDKFIFMLSTRAGGVGINLHTADTVIFFDIDPNPQQDFQAEDRAHRIGQLKQVHVFRFVVLGTVDESLFGHSNRKQALDKAIIKKSMGESEMLAAIRHHTEQLEAANCINPELVDSQLDEIFAEVDRGERTAERGSLFKQVTLQAKHKRSRSEERELESIKPPSEDFVAEMEIDMNSSGYVYRHRRTKKRRISTSDLYEV